MNETIKVMIEKGSCKNYTKEQVSKEDLELILKAGQKASSGMNRQTPRFVVTQDPETVAMLSKMNAKIMGMDIDPFYGAPTVVAVLAKKEGTYIYDGTLALGNMLIAAASLGLGARWIHRCREMFESAEGKELLKKWGVEDEVEGIGFCVIGHPADKVPTQEIVPGRVYYID